MKKCCYQSSSSESKNTCKNIKNSFNLKSSPYKEQSKFIEKDRKNIVDKDFIIHQLTEKSDDRQGNSAIKVNTIKHDLNSRKNHTTRISKYFKNDRKAISTYSNTRSESQKLNSIYFSPDCKGSLRYGSPFKNEEMGYNINYSYKYQKIFGNNCRTYYTNKKCDNKDGKKEFNYEKIIRGSHSGIEVISPLAYIENNSSESELIPNQIRNNENNRYSFNTTYANKNNYQKEIKHRKNQSNLLSLNYKLDEPKYFDYSIIEKNDNKLKQSCHYVNRSQIRNKSDESYTYTNATEIKDFLSPERNINESKKFIKVNMNIISSRGPSNTDRKVNNFMTKVIGTKKLKDVKIKKNKKIKTNENYKYTNELKVRIKAAKIIQAWWRCKNLREEEVYDITVKNAIKLQSFIRGFFVRKRILRYMALAIYYQ